MPKVLVLYATLAVLAVIEAAFADPVHRLDAQPRAAQQVNIAEKKNQTAPTADLLRSMIAWLAAHYDLPASAELPQIEFASPLKLVSMRYKRLPPYASHQDSVLNPSAPAAHQREVVAIYDDKTQTIFLPEGWTGTTPVERSILVHEMVHHMQNLAKMKYECPAAREKLAYEAQSDWLKLRGLDLETEFDVDLFTIFVTSACMN